MNIDVLDALDTQLPPRHALESDDEDEFNPLSSSTTLLATAPDIKVLGDIPNRQSLIIATGNSGTFWARGASLGEQTGAVVVNGIQVGLAFRPAWTKANVIVSETLWSLPVWAMQPYVRMVIDTLQPISVSLLDKYPVLTYISNTPSYADNSPIRYLSTDSAFDPAGQAEAFTPPNLISTTSAAFLSFNSVLHIPSTLLLLPTLSVLKHPPQTLESNSPTHPFQDTDEWSYRLMNDIHQLLLRTINEPKNQQQWQLEDGPQSPRSTAPPRFMEIGEGAMYL